MSTRPGTSVFLVGNDYHLGDLLWLTAVLRAYRQRRGPNVVAVVCPDRPISRILEHNPLIDDLVYGDAGQVAPLLRLRYEAPLSVHDLRPAALGIAMVRQWKRRLPWLYYRDLWVEPRGQWLATFLGLGPLGSGRPVLELTDVDRQAARTLARPFVALAPYIGHYSVPLTGAIWQRLKGWPWQRWERLASHVRSEGYEVVTLAARAQRPIPGTRAITGLPIRQAAGIIEQAAALVSGESGLWFVAAALGTPFIIVPWWLPRHIDWAAPTGVPHRLIYRDRASVNTVLEHVRDIVP